MENGSDGPIDEAAMDTLLKISDSMIQKETLPCTACRYCTDYCPQQLDIPNLLKLYNEHHFTNFIAPMPLIAIPEDRQPKACIACRKCEAVCPQQIKISDAMADFAAKLN